MSDRQWRSTTARTPHRPPVAVDAASAPSSIRVMLKPPKGFDAGGVVPLVSSLM
jgi:hypothetical protein